MRVARRDDVVALVIFLNAVDMEPIKRVMFSTSITSDIVESILEAKMFRGTPGEEELIGFEVDLLEMTIPNPAVGLSLIVAKVGWNLLVDGK